MVLEDETMRERIGRRLRSGHGSVELEDQGIAARSEPHKQDAVARLSGRKGERQREQRVRRTKIAGAGRQRFGMVRGRQPGGAGDIASHACKRFVDGGMCDRGGIDLCAAAGGGDRRYDDVAARRIADEPLLGRIGGGVIARTMEIEEIASEARMADQARRAVRIRERAGRAVAELPMLYAPRPGKALFGRDD